MIGPCDGAVIYYRMLLSSEPYLPFVCLLLAFISAAQPRNHRHGGLRTPRPKPLALDGSGLLDHGAAGTVPKW